MPLRNYVNVCSGTFDPLTTTTTGGTVAGVGVVPMGVNTQKVANLSATVGVLAQTTNMTITPAWQVSDNGTDWEDASPSNHAANVALGTGTAGVDTAVTAVVTAPDAVYGFKWSRCAVTNAVATGASTDLWTVGYNFRTLTGVETL